MKSIVFACAFFWLVSLAYAQVPGWIGAKRAGGTGDDRVQAIAVDSQGNQYITGVFQSTADFGATSLTSSGGYDIFVAKLNSDGTWLWAKRAGGTGYDGGWDIAVDSAGNSYITGRFAGIADFGQFTLENTIDICTYVAKLDTNGNWLWATQTGSHDDDNEASSLALDSQANVYIVGCFWVSVHFGTILFTANGMGDIFIAKLSTDGNWLSATQYGGNGWDSGACVSVDSADHVYVTGYINQTVVFGATSLSSNGADDIFVLELDNSGALQWVKQAGGGNADLAWDIKTDSAANVFITGFFRGTASFGTHQLTSAGGKDAWIAKLDGNGNWLWVLRAGGTGDDEAYGVEIDSSDDVYMIGYFQNAVDFGTTTLTSNGGLDVFIAKEDNAGDWNWMWALQAGGTGNDYGVVLAFDSTGDSYLTGGFNSNIQFGSSELTSSGGYDTFVAKLGTSTGNWDDAVSEIPALSRLYDAYPNPFVSVTTIPYFLKKPSNVKLEVYDLKGRLMFRHAVQNKESGTYKVTWNGTDLEGNPASSGVYLYKLTAGQYTDARKMILLK